MFASDEEALAAAEVAYRKYVAVSDQIAIDGGAGAERLADTVTTEYFITGQSDFVFYQEGNLRGIGMTGVDTFRVQAIQQELGRTKVDAYVCLRLQDARTIDANQKDVTPPNRENNLPLVVSLVAGSPGNNFLVDGGEVWTGPNFC